MCIVCSIMQCSSFRNIMQPSIFIIYGIFQGWLYDWTSVCPVLGQRRIISISAYWTENNVATNAYGWYSNRNFLAKFFIMMIISLFLTIQEKCQCGMSIIYRQEKQTLLDSYFLNRAYNAHPACQWTKQNSLWWYWTLMVCPMTKKYERNHICHYQFGFRSNSSLPLLFWRG